MQNMMIKIFIFCLISTAVFSQDPCQQCREHIIDMETQQRKDQIDGEIPRNLNSYMREKQDCEAICRAKEQQRLYNQRRSTAPAPTPSRGYLPGLDGPPSHNSVPQKQRPLPPGIKHRSELQYRLSLRGTYEGHAYDTLYHVILDTLIACKKTCYEKDPFTYQTCVWNYLQKFRYTKKNRKFFKQFLKKNLRPSFYGYDPEDIDKVIMHILYYLIPLI